MGTLINNITRYYHLVNDDLADPRTGSFPLVSSPAPILIITYMYHKFVTSWGPAFMANRPPYNLKKVIILYNIVQIFLSGYLATQKLLFTMPKVVKSPGRDKKVKVTKSFMKQDSEILCFGIPLNKVRKKEDKRAYDLLNLKWQSSPMDICHNKCLTKLYLSGHYSMWCQKMIYEDTPLETIVINRVWLYYMIKIIDLLDTVFFVLRKKFSHISFLHVYHHMGMCLLGYVGTKYVPGGHGIMLGFINSFVHSVMYSYYLISVVRPQWVRVWWKKYITQLQILQFFILILHFGHVLFEPSCEYPKWVSFMFLPHNIFILFLFCNFYVKEYILKKNKKS